MALHSLLRERERGIRDGASLIKLQLTKRTLDLDLSKTREFPPNHSTGHSSISLHSKDSRYLLSGGHEGRISIFDLTRKMTGYSEMQRCDTIAKVGPSHKGAHSSNVSCVQWFPVDTGIFVSSGMDGKVKVWDTNKVSVVDTFSFDNNPVYSHAMIGGHTLIATATARATVVLCDINTGASTHTLKGHSGAVMEVAWAPHNPHLLASAARDGKVMLWDVRRAKSQLITFDQFNGSQAQQNTTNITSHDAPVNGLCFSPDGLALLSIGSDSRLRKWNVKDGRNTLVNYTGVTCKSRLPVRLCVSLHSGLQVVFVPDKKNINMYDMHAGTLVKVLRGHHSQVFCCAFSPHEVELYSGSAEDEILAWEPCVPEPTTAAHSWDDNA